MRILLAVCIVAVLPAADDLLHAQGTFQNLAFESASLVPIPGDPYGRVQFDAAFPAWGGLVGGAQQNAVLYDNLFLDTSGIGIVDSGWPFGSPPVIQGAFTALLEAGIGGDTSLFQTAVVPISSRSLRFECSLDPISITNLHVTLGAQQLALLSLGTGPNYTVYGADITTLAGQNTTLNFTLAAQNPY